MKAPPELPEVLSALHALVSCDEPLARHTTMRVGGPARFWAVPQNEDELSAVLRAVAKNGLSLRVLGNGSNLIANDAGFDGVILKLGAGFSWQQIEGERLRAGGATLLPMLCKFALQHCLGNMEWTCGIPGSVGGSIWGNAGARGWNGDDFETRDCAADVESLAVFDQSGKRRELGRSDVEFAYRRSSLGELIVAEATFKLKPLSEAQAKTHRAVVQELLKKRRASQPVSAASAGCVWKNPDLPDCRGAGELIERLGLKGHEMNGAQVSTVHANFIVNTGTATGATVRALMQEVEAVVHNKTGVQLEREVRLLD